MTRRTPLLIAAALIAVHLAAEATLRTPDWAWHPRTVGWQLSAVVALTIPLAFMAYEPLVAAGVLMFAGVSGNLISSLSGPVGNPLLIDRLAFNLADVWLAAGFVAAAAALPWVFRDIHRRIEASA